MQVSVSRSVAPRLRGLAVAVAVVALNALLLRLVIEAGRRDLVNVDWLMRDASAVTGSPPYTGGYQYLAVLAWAAGAAIPLFALAILTPERRATWGRVLGLGGAYMAVACLDDLFMLHEHTEVAGIPEPLLAAHAAVMLLFLASLARVWRQTPWVVLAGALAGLGGSVGIDLMQNLDLTRGSSDFRVMLIEEFLKLTGICLMTAFLAMVSARALRDA